MSQLQHAKRYFLVPKEEYERTKTSKRINPFTNPHVKEAKRIRNELSSQSNDVDNYNEFLSQQQQIKQYLSNIDKVLQNRSTNSQNEERKKFEKDARDQRQFIEPVSGTYKDNKAQPQPQPPPPIMITPSKQHSARTKKGDMSEGEYKRMISSVPANQQVKMKKFIQNLQNAGVTVDDSTGIQGGGMNFTPSFAQMLLKDSVGEQSDRLQSTSPNWRKFRTAVKNLGLIEPRNEKNIKTETKTKTKQKGKGGAGKNIPEWHS